jgi:hypothetical protein
MVSEPHPYQIVWVDHVDGMPCETPLGGPVAAAACPFGHRPEPLRKTSAFKC